MANPIDPDDEMPSMVPRKGEATAKGGHVYQRLLQLAEIRHSGQIHRIAMFIAMTYKGDFFPSTCSSRAQSTKRSATTCCSASTPCVGGRPTCTA